MPDTAQSDKTNAQLEAELATIKKQLADLAAKLEDAGKPAAPFKREPHERIDYTARASMDGETMRDLAKAIPDSLARDLHADLARGNPVTQSQSLLSQDRVGGRVEIRGSGWAAPNPITPPPGVEICDRIMDAADAQDRADLARRLARTKE